MKVLIQWAKKNPTDWVELDSAAWSAAPKKPDPVGGEVLDKYPGWVNRICVQGVEFTSDHYAIEDVPEISGCRVYSWSDDPEDYLPGYRNAKVVEFYPLSPDSHLGGAYNTKQVITHYVESEVLKNIPSGLDKATVRPWSEFVKPSEEITRHGIWIAQGLYDQHEARRRVRGWREWTDGLDPSLIMNGRLRPQRAIGLYSVPSGTRTYYHNDTSLATSVHNVNGGNDERALELTPAGVSSVSSQNLGGGASALLFCATSPANEPDQNTWPSGTYRCQIDCTSAGADITYGLLTAGTAVGHFGRVNSALTTEVATNQQDEGAFSLTGLKLATWNGNSTQWDAGGQAQSDRFEILIAGTRAANHGNQSITLDLGEADDFADGPWEEAAADNSIFFGCNF